MSESGSGWSGTRTVQVGRVLSGREAVSRPGSRGKGSISNRTRSESKIAAYHCLEDATLRRRELDRLERSAREDFLNAGGSSQNYRSRQEVMGCWQKPSQEIQDRKKEVQEFLRSPSSAAEERRASACKGRNTARFRPPEGDHPTFQRGWAWSAQ